MLLPLYLAHSCPTGHLKHLSRLLQEALWTEGRTRVCLYPQPAVALSSHSRLGLGDRSSQSLCQHARMPVCKLFPLGKLSRPARSVLAFFSCDVRWQRESDVAGGVPYLVLGTVPWHVGLGPEWTHRSPCLEPAAALTGHNDS